MRRAMSVALAATILGLTAGPARAVSSDSLAPPDAPPHWLPPEAWVYNHWLPYDESRLYELLGVSRGRIWRQLRDDRRNIAELAAAHGHPDPSKLATALLADRRAKLSKAQYTVLHDRAERTLTQGHLAQHLLFHSLHQFAIPSAAPEIFGVTDVQFRELRRQELSPLEVGRLHGRSPDRIQALSADVLRERATTGVRGQAMPARQGKLLLSRQLSQLPRWLDQGRYNGPPPTHKGKLVAKPRDYASNPTLTADGRRVVYEAYAQKLPKALKAGEISVRSYALSGGASRLASVPNAARRTPRSAYNPSVGADGRVVAYESAEGNQNFAKRYGQIDVFVRDTRRPGRPRTIAITHPEPTAQISRSTYNPQVSADGSTLAFQAARRDGDVARAGIWVRPLAAKRSRLATGAVPGDVYEPSLSGDGTRLAFTAVKAGGASEVWVADLSATPPALRRVSTGPGAASSPTLSADGSHVAYTAAVEREPSRLVVVDLATGRSTPVASAEGGAIEPSLSGDGRSIAFTSLASGTPRVLLCDLHDQNEATVVAARGSSSDPVVSADGRRVVFASDATAPGKADDTRGVFVWDAASRRATLVSGR